MPKSIAISHYGNALFSLASEEKQVKEYLSALLEIEDFLNKNEETREFLESYALETSSKMPVLEALAKPYKLKHLLAFLSLLSDKHLMKNFSAIVQSYRKLANESLGIKEGIVYSAAALSQKDLERISKLLEKDLNSEVSLTNRVESSLLGGIRVYIDERVYDASVKGKLERMRKQLLSH